MISGSPAPRVTVLGALVGLLRGAAILAGLFFSTVAGSLYLGAYAQGFRVLYSFRTQGSDGYPFTWDTALLLAGIAACIVLLLTLALPHGRLSNLYLLICLAVACVGAALPLVPPSSRASNWLGLLTIAIGALLIGAGGWNARLGRWIGPLAAGTALAVMLVSVGAATVRDRPPRPRLRPTAVSLYAAVELPPSLARRSIAGVGTAPASVARRTERAGAARYPRPKRAPVTGDHCESDVRHLGQAEPGESSGRGHRRSVPTD